MNTPNGQSCRNLLAAAMALLAAASAAAARTVADRRQKHAHDQVRRIIEAAVTYSFQGYEDLRRKLQVCSIDPSVGASDNVLRVRLRRRRIRLVSRTWIRDRIRPPHFLYIDVQRLQRLTQWRARVEAYICTDFNSEVLAEYSENLDVERIHGRWIVNTKRSSIQVGE